MPNPYCQAVMVIIREMRLVLGGQEDQISAIQHYHTVWCMIIISQHNIRRNGIDIIICTHIIYGISSNIML